MTKKLFIFILFPFLSITGAWSQNISINPQIKTQKWPAKWITHPTAPVYEYGVFHFRKNFDLNTVPDEFIIHVSADNRYKLYINGQFVAYGPSRGDLANWYFETIDIAKHLQKGKNTLAVLVWNMGEYKPVAQISHQTAFILQGNGKKEQIVNTNKSWKIIQNKAYAPAPLSNFNIDGYIVTGACDKVNAAKYPYGWQQPIFNDALWKQAKEIMNGAPKLYGTGYTWSLTPNTIPQMENKKQRFKAIRRTIYIEVDEDFINGEKSFTVPPNSKAIILFDQGHLTVGYPELVVSGGKDAVIELKCSEALFDKNRKKGNRNEINERTVIGYSDFYKTDGESKRKFTPLWIRTFRYVNMIIQTADEEITIDDFYSYLSVYPFKKNAYFKSDQEKLQNIWDVGWRTARLCAGETYFDCPYYEQLQYVGDTRIQALISLYVSGDDRLMRKTIHLFNQSRLPNGLTMSRYPVNSPQIIPPYSLFWISMVYDYHMHRNDPDFIKDQLWGVQNVLHWFEQHIDENTGMLGATPFWNFVDWAWAWKPEIGIGGVPKGGVKGNSSILTLQFAYTLDQAAELFKFYNRDDLAKHYEKISLSLKQATLDNCWDKQKNVFADTPEKTAFSQHANIFAILTNTIPETKQQELLTEILTNKKLTQATFYFKFYLFRALNHTGNQEKFLPLLAPWHNMIDSGLTTFSEKPDPTRSDCHAWSASPNYEFLSTICGITPAAPGFSSVKIAPSPGSLEWIETKMPHPNGDIYLALSFKKDKTKGEIKLPQNLKGEFIWKGQKIKLTPGTNKIKH